jgi:gliding motility-associated-like protein
VDCEEVRINGTYLGYFGGPDENAASLFGTSASFHYRMDEFVGLGTDHADVPIFMADALTDLSALVANNATSFNVTYNHCGNPISPWGEDNLVNMMLVAYAADICSLPLDLGPDTLLCAGESIVLNATLPGATYVWNDGITSGMRTVDEPGTYVVTPSHPECNWPADTIVVDFAPALQVDLGSDRVICSGQEVLLAVPLIPGTAFTWADGNTDNPRSVTAPGIYSITTTFGRCSYSDSVSVAVDDCPFAIELPNIFTPNGDATNTAFAPLRMDGVQRLAITIYNRWGQSVFTSAALNFQWDGRTTAGLPVPDGTYFWVLTYVPLRGDGSEQAMTGTVTITR